MAPGEKSSAVASRAEPPPGISAEPRGEGNLPTQEVKAYFPLSTEMYALITHGRNMGIFGTILEISETAGVTKSIAAIETPEGEIYRTTRDYLFIVGKEKPTLSLWKPEEV